LTTLRAALLALSLTLLALAHFLLGAGLFAIWVISAAKCS